LPYIGSGIGVKEGCIRGKSSVMFRQEPMKCDGFKSRRHYMRKITGIIIGAILISLIAPIVAELPSSTMNAGRESVEQPYNVPIMNSISPVYAWGGQPLVDLSGINPAVFRNSAFSKIPGGLLSGSTYTESINHFLKDHLDEGVSRVAKKGSKIGLVHWS